VAASIASYPGGVTIGTVVARESRRLPPAPHWRDAHPEPPLRTRAQFHAVSRHARARALSDAATEPDRP